jgi:negative regulator of flagellin synthesis FlgM
VVFMGIGIWGDLPGVSQVQAKEKLNKAYAGQEVSNIQPKKDHIEISNISKDYHVVANGLRDVPDIREEKVKELLEKINEGTYIISEEDVVNKFFELLQTNEV